MSIDKSKVRHDFINNGLRLEILNKLITESLEGNNEIDPEQVKDLKEFLGLHLELTKQLEEHYL